MLILRYTIRTDWVKKLTVDSLQFETECIQQVSLTQADVTDQHITAATVIDMKLLQVDFVTVRK